MKIYTKKGDTGTTGLIGGTRVRKDHARIEAYGTVDELNAFLGLLRDEEAIKRHLSLLKVIQDKLFTIGSHLASDPEKTSMKLPSIEESDIFLLEKSMDMMEEELPPLKNFVLPGGCRANSLSHVCRTICRRAERRAVEIHEVSPVNPLILKYLNRLSDWLFVLGRHVSHLSGAEERIWEGR